MISRQIQKIIHSSKLCYHLFFVRGRRHVPQYLANIDWVHNSSVKSAVVKILLFILLKRISLAS